MKRIMPLWGLLLMMPALAVADEYPTLDRVEYVYQCMRDHGGENYTSLYQCSCAIDYIASQLSYDDYITADTFTRGQHAAGERGSIFREPPEAREMRSRLADLQKAADQRCLVSRVSDR